MRVLEVTGLINSVVFFRKGGNGIAGAGLSFLLVCYVFIRGCDLINWYPGKTPPGGQKHIGIRVHFEKALVPISYILALVSSFCLLNIPYLTVSLVVLGCLFMSLFAPVNGILLYFHLRDRDSLPMNYFSHNEYLEKLSKHSA